MEAVLIRILWLQVANTPPELTEEFNAQMSNCQNRKGTARPRGDQNKGSDRKSV